MRAQKIKFVVILFLTLQVLKPVGKKKNHWDVYFQNIKKRTVRLRCEDAATTQEKTRGLMFRERLKKDHGMIFVYKRPQILYFWMKHTQIPLSIAFVDKNFIITGIHHLNPHDEKITSSSVKVLYAIEADRGWFRKNYIFPRSKITITKK